MNNIDFLYHKMLEYYSADPMRSQHFVKVHSFCALIGRGENLDSETQEILEVAALVHDIGIKVAETKYGKSSGKLQEQEGPAVAEAMLQELGYSEKIIDRVSFLVAHHHTYTDVVGIDYQILLEADFIVNMYEDEMSATAIDSAINKIFKTKTGIKICRDMFCAKT